MAGPRHGFTQDLLSIIKVQQLLYPTGAIKFATKQEVFYSAGVRGICAASSTIPGLKSCAPSSSCTSVPSALCSPRDSSSLGGCPIIPCWFTPGRDPGSSDFSFPSISAVVVSSAVAHGYLLCLRCLRCLHQYQSRVIIITTATPPTTGPATHAMLFGAVLKGLGLGKTGGWLGAVVPDLAAAVPDMHAVSNSSSPYAYLRYAGCQYWVTHLKVAQ